MAVLLESDDLRQVHRTWPMNMRLAVCLMPSGDCQLLMFRQEEFSSFPQRLRKHLGLRPEELSIYPPVPGFPSRGLKYSDERSLAALLADSPGLLEDAQDYSANFSYALEEGLDPVAFLGFEGTPERGQLMPTHHETAADEMPAFASAWAEPTAGQDGLQFSSRRHKPAVPAAPMRKLHFDLMREAARSDAPTAATVQEFAETGTAPIAPPAAGFIPADQLIALDTPPGAYHLHRDDRWITLSRGAGPAVEITDARTLFLRDDHQLVAIALPGQAQVPATLRMARAGMPDLLRGALEGALGEVTVTFEAGYAYVALPEKQKVSTPTPLYDAAKSDAAAQKPARGFWGGLRRTRAMRLLAMTTATTLAIFLIMSAFPNGSGEQKSENNKVDWNQFRLSMQSDRL
ncbi:hypothetical protein N6L24_14260 [Cognatishimia sp. SS12]|uniref:hypothetical protein n=1 Tax=Cognatishimia sp. SS12 TaxID=2979465 RepID=UPI0023305D52|nr:hypothetical protein [Cognatishimia sp. SS12]MDC0739448.1 hypothetical protein [Cognatishimia sp. SS12]